MSLEESINTPETFSTEEEQMLLLTELNGNIESYRSLINRSFEMGQLNCVIEGASKLIGCLRTSQFTPKNYYKIYHAVSTILLSIFQNLQDEERFPNEKIAELYETVQYLSGCMQRLYLMITIGTELGRRGIVKINDVLDDLSDMSRAVQDPIRALFLRHYLLSIFKQYLPDQNEKATERSLNFLLNNFAQMNRMWVRIEDIMGSDERKEQRSEFSVLIGTNIQRISALNGINVEIYSTVIFPFIAKHVELCEDALAQEFILKSIIHAFPEEFHIATVDLLFTVFVKVEQGVKILEIVNQLLERFLQYIGHLIDPQKSSEVFVTIAKNIEELFNAEGHLSLTAKFETLQRLLRFALKINTNDVKNVKNLMKFTDFHIDLVIGEESLTKEEQSEQLKKFLEVPLTVFTSAQYLYKIEYLPILVGRLRLVDRFYIAEIICNVFLKSATKITNVEELTFFIRCTSSLVRETSGASCFFSIIHLIQAESDDKTIELLREMRKQLDGMTNIAEEKFVVPLSMLLIQFYSLKNCQSAYDFLLSFLADNNKEYPSKTIIVYLELIKLAYKKGDTKTMNEMYDIVLKELPLVEKRTIIYHTVELITHMLDSLPLACNEVFDILIEMTKKVQSLLMKIKMMCDIIMLIWRKTKDVEKIMTLMKDAEEIILNTDNDIGLALNAFYILLDTTIYFLDNQVELGEEWLITLLSLISVRHREILDTGKRLDSVVTTNGKRYYINLARYIQARKFIKD